MREIKFRYIFEDSIGKKHILTQTIEELENHLDVLKNIQSGWKLIAREEYTGLKDKNGVEIYEGDILVYTDWNYDLDEALGDSKYAYQIDRGEVIWSNDEAKFGFNHFPDDFDIVILGDVKVLGNIYEHPELIKEHNG